MGQSSRRKLKTPRSLMKLGGLVSAQAVRAWMSTLDFRAVYYDHTVDPVFGVGGPRIFIFWHENILMPLYLRGHCHLAMLLSQHNDAEILARVAYHMGFDCVRGSTYRGGSRAIRELFVHSRRQHLTMTPDGPRGPRRQMAPGPVYLASRLQLPLVAIGFGYDRPWRVNSWDRFAVPRPFSRGRAVMSPPLEVPPDLDRAGLERCRERVERLMNCLTLEAEAWAESGTRKAGEVIMKSQSAPRPTAFDASRVRSELARPSRVA
jgi:lysophospholipid acyltransferase (LPLAT)-like uncharacterized protein